MFSSQCCCDLSEDDCGVVDATVPVPVLNSLRRLSLSQWAFHRSNSIPESGDEPSAGGLRNWHVVSCLSKSKSWPMKWKLGEIFDFLDLTKSYASLSERAILNMRYAIVIVTEREIPARQCTSTPSSLERPSSKEKKK